MALGIGTSARQAALGNYLTRLKSPGFARPGTTPESTGVPGRFRGPDPSSMSDWLRWRTKQLPAPDITRTY